MPESLTTTSLLTGGIHVAMTTMVTVQGGPASMRRNFVRSIHTADGGAIYVDSSVGQATLSGVVLEQNVVSAEGINATSARGAGVFAAGKTDISGCQFTYHDASIRGSSRATTGPLGSVYFIGPNDYTVHGSSFTNNVAYYISAPSPSVRHRKS
jgi:hypothetical protein